MIKLEEKMYVRTKCGIAKIIEIEKSYNEFIIETDNYITIDDTGFTEQEMVERYKISHNIIDLIEERDLLTIEYYSERYKERVTRLFEVTYKDKEFINLDNAKCQFMLTNGEWSTKDIKLNPIIKSVVTKEQFDNMEYEVK